MALSLNQIISRIRTLALSHRQINKFYFGDPWEFDAGADNDYPACFLEQLPGSIDRVEKLQKFSLRVYLLSRVLVAEDTEGNETEVLSDMSQVAADILAMFMSTAYQDDWIIEERTPVTSVTEALNDMLGGVYMDIGIGVDFLADSCQVPSEDVTFDEQFDMARTKLLTYEADGTEGDSFTVPGLSGKNVLCVYRAGNYRRAITTTPTVDDKIKVTGTDLGSNKGILSSDGSVELVSGDGLVDGEILDFLIWSE